MRRFGQVVRFGQVAKPKTRNGPLRCGGTAHCAALEAMLRRASSDSGISGDAPPSAAAVRRMTFCDALVALEAHIAVPRVVSAACHRIFIMSAHKWQLGSDFDRRNRQLNRLIDAVVAAMQTHLQVRQKNRSDPVSTMATTGYHDLLRPSTRNSRCHTQPHGQTLHVQHTAAHRLAQVSIAAWAVPNWRGSTAVRHTACRL